MEVIRVLTLVLWGLLDIRRMTIVAHAWPLQARLHCMLLLFLLLFFLESLFRWQQVGGDFRECHLGPETKEWTARTKKLKVLKTNSPRPNFESFVIEAPSCMFI